MAFKRTDIINHLIDIYGYTRYLEIGVGNRKNLNSVNAAHKDGVDPSYPCSYNMTSEKFFEELPEDIMYDIVFVDGFHNHKQVLRDINNSLNHLSPNGTIVAHDCCPWHKSSQKKEPKPGKPWYGTTWRAIAKLRSTREDLDICVVNRDCGCAIIRRGNQKLFPLAEGTKFTFEFLDEHRKELLNLISEEEFLEKFK